MLQDGDYVAKDLWGFFFLEQVKWLKQWSSSFIKITCGALQIGLCKWKVFDVNLTTARKSEDWKKRDGEGNRNEGSVTGVLMYLAKRKVKLLQ